MTMTRGALAVDLAERVFAGPIAGSLIPRRLGAEVEFIPVESLSGRRCGLVGDGTISTLPFLRRYGDRQGWRENRTSKGTPCFSLPSGGTLTFEPGGQLEYSSPACRSASSLLALLRSVVLPLRAAAAGEGIDLLAVGIDPLNTVERAPMVIHANRYERMAEYLGRLGPSGARMMRQTAAFQVSVDLDDEPWLRWRVLNSAAPYVVAIFANSPIYAGELTGHQSARADVWRQLDPARTGIPFDERAPLEAYLEFALTAPAILFPTVSGEHLPFGEWLARANPTAAEWQEHLSTLFPEVRPRGHLELRSADAIAPEWYAAPLALTAGILYDPHALRAAADLLPLPDLGLLERAGRLGLHDPAIARTAADLFDLALTGCGDLGPGYFHPSDLEQARAFFDRYTRRSRAPADDVLQDAIAA
ncbi:MAG: ergothioneine biosynthesis glutamate--cysteine ligase EgtA [Gemmatimonadales bacterium]|nr:ergothioneine biosynthesis glutamate--cysteine ligase EgtA [Gemmatimonadales bacterium]